MPELGKLLLVAGILIALAGALIMFYGKIPWLGKLPGDISFRRENFSFYFPLASSILISVIFSFILWLLRK